MDSDNGAERERSCVISSKVLKYDGSDGVDLRTIIDSSGPMDPRDVVPIARQLTRALSRLHQDGLVHRDVAPANVLFERRPSGHAIARLVDFGSVCLIDKPSALAFIGDSAFSAPELIREEPADPRTDIYQLGCLLHFLLTGEPPYSGKTRRDMLDAHLHQAPPRASDLAPLIRRWALDELILQMLEKEPDCRPADCQVVLDVLRDPAGSPGNRAASAASISSIGPDDSFVTVVGKTLMVRRDDIVTHFDLGDATVSALHADAGRVFYGTDRGAVCELDLQRSSTKRLTQLARGRRVVDVTRGGTIVVVADAAGDVFVVEPGGEYRVIRCTSGAASAGVVAIAAAGDPGGTFAVARTDRSVTVYAGSALSESARSVIDFPIEQLALSPDGYIVAAIGDTATWIINALNGTILHRIRIQRRGAFTFRGPTLVGLEVTHHGQSHVFEIY